MEIPSDLAEKGLRKVKEDREKNPGRFSLHREDGSFRWMKFLILLTLFLVIVTVVAMAVLGKFGKFGGKKKGRKPAARPMGHAVDTDAEINNGTTSTSSMQPTTSFGFGSGAFTLGAS